VLYQQGNYEAALEPLGLAIALSPTNLQPLINRAWTNVALDRLPAAQADFAAAFALSPEQAEALCGWVMLPPAPATPRRPPWRPRLP
jgi:Flp pilus assembly protein TadD